MSIFRTTRRRRLRTALAALAVGGLMLTGAHSSGAHHTALAAGRLPDRPAATQARPPGSPRTSDAFAHLEPQAGGPANGGSVTLGSRFNLNLMVNSGTYNVVVAQSYLTFTNSLLQVVNATAPSCVPTSTLTIDPARFDSELQNEVCNDSAPCDFGRIVSPPASIAFASGSAPTSPSVQDDFRVAQLGLCANTLGDAVLHWQFSPPATGDRDSEVVDAGTNVVSNPTLYNDFVIHIVQPKLIGHVTWQGIAQPDPTSIQPITLTVKSPDGSIERDFSATTDASGFFTVTMVTPGNVILPGGAYNWRVKGSRSLANTGTFNLSAGDVFTRVDMDTVYAYTPQCASGCLRGGDANNDNRGNASDFNILRATFGKTVGQIGYDARADFDNNDTVAGTDFNILRSNFGLGGAPPVLPGGGGRITAASNK